MLDSLEVVIQKLNNAVKIVNEYGPPKSTACMPIITVPMTVKVDFVKVKALTCTTTRRGRRSFWQAWTQASIDSFLQSISLLILFRSLFEIPGCSCPHNNYHPSAKPWASVPRSLLSKLNSNSLTLEIPLLDGCNLNLRPQTTRTLQNPWRYTCNHPQTYVFQNACLHCFQSQLKFFTNSSVIWQWTLCLNTFQTRSSQSCTWHIQLNPTVICHPWSCKLHLWCKNYCSSG